ncbi:MAG TPA: flagellar assembly protein FliW [Chloroflexi bacterium]|jgi:flagellar assembly factor FliW|nr:flagellar assembly protein FliW [Chloroflexota bacterium]
MSQAPLVGKRMLIFPDGLVGYPEWRRFTLEGAPDGSPVAWLQGMDDEGASFLVTEPRLVCPTFTIEVPAHVRAALGLAPTQEPRTLCMLVIKPEPLTITANLLGPIVYNPDSGVACQMVLAESNYSARHPVVVTELDSGQGGGAC